MDKFLEVDRVAFSIKGYDIYWYGLIICAAIIVAVLVATLFCKKKGYNTDMPLNIALVILPTGILTARLFSVLFDVSLDLSDFFNFRTGGMSIIGAVVGGGLGLLAFCLIRKEKNIFRYFDVLVVVLILAQAIGRWGNYFNGEVYGQIVDPNSAYAFFPFVVRVNGVLYQALFFYEFALNMIGFAVLYIVFMGSKNNGFATGTYLVYYGIVRTCLESLRQPEFILEIAGLPISKICSIAMIAVGIIILIVLNIKHKKRKGANNE